MIILRAERRRAVQRFKNNNYYKIDQIRGRDSRGARPRRCGVALSGRKSLKTQQYRVILNNMNANGLLPLLTAALAVVIVASAADDDVSSGRRDHATDLSADPSPTSVGRWLQLSVRPRVDVVVVVGRKVAGPEDRARSRKHLKRSKKRGRKDPEVTTATATAAAASTTAWSVDTRSLIQPVSRCGSGMTRDFSGRCVSDNIVFD